ncbi:hypothetical protein [Ascidiaceihabitans sp.]|uniref:hypothetical protein n=1 Tax=Ascidiaceihabitans sp. TaxID=1872644 RepID=UPI003299A54E
MIRRLVALSVVACLAIALFYVSRFWFLELWGRPGLFGFAELPARGGLLAGWLRGTMFAPFELLIWGCGVFLVLTWAEKLFARFKRGKDQL